MNHQQVSDRKALVLGGTGAMGVYLVPELRAMGYQVLVVSMDRVESNDPRISYVTADAKSDVFLKELLKDPFEVIVDFLMYATDEFEQRHEMLLKNTDHYFFLSSYRVYSGRFPITEETPRLLEVSEDQKFLNTEDYSLYKARQEDILQQSKYDNWTIVRPAITYSKFRFQLVTLEAPVVVARAFRGLPIVLPKEALNVQGTMSWAGDVAKMFARLVLNPAAFRECFTLATAEHHSWGEIAEYYREIIGLEYLAVETDDYLKIMGGYEWTGYQLYYDRLFDRVVDNSKVLRVTGLKQSELMPLRLGLEKELTATPIAGVWSGISEIGQKMDEYLNRI